MPLNLTSPITGAAMTLLTSPTATIVVDNWSGPGRIGKQWLVSALGGTQTGVLPHSVTLPYTVAVTRPAVLKGVSQVNPLTGIARPPGSNQYVVHTRKGMYTQANQAPDLGDVKIICNIPAGAETYNSTSVESMLSITVGAIIQLASEMGITLRIGAI